MLVALSLLVSVSASAGSLSDPTQPPRIQPDKARVEVAPPLRVEAIIRRGERNVAIVEGKLVRPGDRIGAVLIQEINGDSVRYSRDGQSHVIQLKDSKVRVRQTAAREDWTS